MFRKLKNLDDKKKLQCIWADILFSLPEEHRHIIRRNNYSLDHYKNNLYKLNFGNVPKNIQKALEKENIIQVG